MASEQFHISWWCLDISVFIAVCWAFSDGLSTCWASIFVTFAISRGVWVAMCNRISSRRLYGDNSSTILVSGERKSFETSQSKCISRHSVNFNSSTENHILLFFWQRYIFLSLKDLHTQNVSGFAKITTWKRTGQGIFDFRISFPLSSSGRRSSTKKSTITTDFQHELKEQTSEASSQLVSGHKGENHTV